MYFPAIILPVIEGGYAAMFPDLPEAFSQGTNIEECIFMAQDALNITLEEYAKSGNVIPAPSDMGKLEIIMEQEMQDEGIDPGRKPFIQIFIAPELDTPAAKMDISVPKFALSAVNEKPNSISQA